jgi:O-antigen/teichoic acid export membrane protein
VTGDARPAPASDTPRRAFRLQFLANLSLPVTAVVAAPLLARTLGTDGRGLLAGLIAVLSLTPLVFGIGLAEAVRYNTATYGVVLPSVRRAALRTSLALAPVAVLVVWVAAPYLVNHKPDATRYLRWGALYVPPMLWYAVVRAELQGLRSNGVPAVERWLQTTLRMAAFVALWLAHRLTVGTALLAHLGSGVVAGLLLVAGARRRAVPDATARAVARREVVSYGLRSWSGGLVGVVLLRLDQAIMLPVAGAKQLGMYAVAVSLAELPLLAGTALRSVLTAEAAAVRSLDLVSATGRRCVAVVLAIAVAAVPVAHPFVVVVFGRDFAGAAPMLVVLLFACAPAMLLELTGAALGAVGRPGTHSAGIGIGAGLTLVLLVPAVAVAGGVGAAVVSLLSYALSAGFCLARLHRVAGVPPRDFALPRRDDLRWLLREGRRAIPGGGRGRTVAE